MAGLKCKHEFCFECGADHRQILALDNSAHGADCKFHPDNFEDDGGYFDEEVNWDTESDEDDDFE